MTTLKIDGMTCGHCQKAVQTALESVAGSRDVKVDLERGLATVEGQADTGSLIAAVQEEGYQATVAPTTAPGGGRVAG